MVITNIVFYPKDSGHSVETGLEGEQSQHTAILEERVFKRLDFDFPNLGKADHLGK